MTAHHHHHHEQKTAHRHKKYFWQHYDLLTVAIGIPLMIMISLMFKVYLIEPLTINLRIGYWTHNVLVVSTYLFFVGGWIYLSKKETIESEIDLHREIELAFSPEKMAEKLPVAFLTPHEAEERLKSLIHYISERISDNDWDEAWAFYEQADEIATSTFIPHKSAYYEKLYQLKEQIERERYKEQEGI